MADCLVAFGSNLGDSRQCFADAVEMLRANSAIESVACSDAILTEPVGGPDGQAEFLNACIRFSTSLSSRELFERLCGVEKALGRERRFRWGSRKIDLDLLLYETQVIATELLIVPHPRMSFRRFVLHPANQIAADMVHPLSAMSIRELIAHLDGKKNRIVFVCRRTEENQRVAGTMKEKLRQFQWELETVVDSTEYKLAIDEAKLVVFFKDVEPELLERAVRFKGPTLNLGEAVDRELVMSEIGAAIKAMSSL